MIISELESPLVSIIINCYNGDRFLQKAIDSIYLQNYSNWEIIFWDNCSTDNSADIALSYDERVKYHRAVQTTPLGEARNIAQKEAVGKYIAFLDCDDLYLPEKLEKQVRLMEGSNYAMCYGSAITINEQGQVLKKVPVKNQSGNLFGSLLKHYEINMQSVMLRRSILIEEQLSFATELKYCPDHNLFMEISSRFPVGVLQDFIIKYRLLEDSLSRKTVDIVSTELRFTFDNILERAPELRKEFAKEFESAYNKLHYYDAVAAIYNNDRKQARTEIWSVIETKVEYFFVYLLLLLPLSNQRILKFLSR
jgi:glycosyltransferase involved in cell wall biosynthesis